jgi:hypothetical protein
MQRFIAMIVVLLFASSAFAADAVCPELSAVQRWVGYLSWMGFFKVCGIAALAAGVIIFFHGFIKWAWDSLWAVIRDVADILAHVVSIGLIVSGAWTPAEYQLWPVLGGCILFGGSVFLTIWLRNIKGDDPTGICALFTVVWGAVAIYYGMPEVGFLAVAAFMGVLGFSVAVTPFCYAFGFRKEGDIPSATAAALLILVIYVVVHVFFPNVPTAGKVFEAGAFWLGSFVGFLGLLILSNKWYVRAMRTSYAWIQLVTVAFYMVGVAAGMTFGINPLAGMAGTFLVFYAADKLIEIETQSVMTFGLKLMLVGAVFSGAWFFANQHEALVKTYLTTSLPM